jgi:cation diffusion facilitator family transporter
MAQYAFFAYKKCDSLSLKADGWHHRSDAISSLVILVGIFVGKFVWWADGVLTLIVAAMIAWTAYHIIRDGIRPLLGEAPDDKLLDYIRSTCDDELNKKSDVHHVHLHRYGDHMELTFHLSFPADISLEEAHRRITLIENRLRQERRIEATIHPEPLSNDN